MNALFCFGHVKALLGCFLQVRVKYLISEDHLTFLNLVALIQACIIINNVYKLTRSQGQKSLAVINLFPQLYTEV